MKKQASPTLIGAFVVGGLALIAVAIVAVAGNDLFTRKERAVMHFSGSIYGLQVGAPVMFRGVRVGSVTSIRVLYDKHTDTFSIPVLADLEGNAVRGLDGKRARSEGAALGPLVQRGLRAQLSMQSLLTGLLYVDLDLHPERPATFRDRSRTEDAIEIPTSDTAIQNLKQQLDGMDFRRLVEDISAIAASGRALVGGPHLRKALEDLEQITGNLKHLSGRLDQQIDPLASDARRTLADATRAFDKLGGAADGVQSTARHLQDTSDSIKRLLAPDAPLVQQLQRSAEELARTASALRQTTAADSPLLRNTDRALQDVSRASRALRDLAEALEQNPEALLRGRPAAAPANAAPAAPNTPNTPSR